MRQAYAYILSSPGTPVVYWSHMYDWGHGELIRELIRIRRAAGVRADSAIEFHSGYSGLVATVRGTAQTLVVALGSDLQDPSQVASGSFNPALDEDSGQVRIWTTGSTGGGDGGEGLVNVDFRCDNGVTQPGDSVYAVGNLTELGNWSPAGAVRLTDVSRYPTWAGTLALPAEQAVEWKCIVRSETRPTDVKTWQPGGNNRFMSAEGVSTQGSF